MVNNPEEQFEDKEEEGYKGIEDGDLEDGELEALEQQEAKASSPAKKKILSTKPTPATKTPKEPVAEPDKEPVKQRRYGVFSQEARRGIADLETGEVLGEGETVVLDVLSDIVERLERIETNIGNFGGD